MPDPVLNRPMFQGSTPSAPSAKGTGITSMVTPPDVAAEQLRSIVNPMKPIVQGFADGGPATSMWQRFVQSLTVPEPDRSGTYRLPDVGLRIGRNDEFRKDAGIMGASSTPNYVEPMDIGGPDAIISSDQKNRIYRDADLMRAADQQITDPRVAENLEADRVSRERQQRARDAGIPAGERATTAILQGAEPLHILPRALTNKPDALTQLDMETGREAARARGLGSLVDAPALPKGDEPIKIAESEQKPQRQATSDVGLNLQQIKADREAKSSADRRENALLALMNAGFAMAAGKSPHALQNIGAGGQAGIQAFAEMEKGRRDSEYRQAMQDLHERELRMRQEELGYKAPLYKAQAKAQEDLPAYRERIAANREFLAKQRAIEAADKEYDNLLKNPSSTEAMRIREDKTGTYGPALKKQLENKHLSVELRRAQVEAYNDSLGIRSVTTPE